MDQHLLDRIETLLAKEEVREVLMRYARGADRADAELIESCFHPDAVDDHGTVELTGVQTAPRFSALPQVSDAGRVGQHFMGNIDIDIDDTDRTTAYAESYFIAVRIIDREGVEYTRFRGARYLDRFERRDGDWRIAYRVVVDDWDRIDALTERAPESAQWRRGALGADDPAMQFRLGAIADNEAAIRARLGVMTR